MRGSAQWAQADGNTEAGTGRGLEEAKSRWTGQRGTGLGRQDSKEKQRAFTCLLEHGDELHVLPLAGGTGTASPQHVGPALRPAAGDSSGLKREKA